MYNLMRSRVIQCDEANSGTWYVLSSYSYSKDPASSSCGARERNKDVA